MVRADVPVGAAGLTEQWSTSLSLVEGSRRPVGGCMLAGGPRNMSFNLPDSGNDF
jgi:hypothetical protein